MGPAARKEFVEVLHPIQECRWLYPAEMHRMETCIDRKKRLLGYNIVYSYDDITGEETYNGIVRQNPLFLRYNCMHVYTSPLVLLIHELLPS